MTAAESWQSDHVWLMKRCHLISFEKPVSGFFFVSMMRSVCTTPALQMDHSAEEAASTITETENAIEIRLRYVMQSLSWIDAIT